MSQLKVCLKRYAASPGCGVARAFLRAQALLFGGYRNALQRNQVKPYLILYIQKDQRVRSNCTVYELNVFYITSCTTQRYTGHYALDMKIFKVHYILCGFLITGRRSVVLRGAVLRPQLP